MTPAPRPKVLVASDTAQVLQRTAMDLEHLGYAVAAHRDGASALAAVGAVPGEHAAVVLALRGAAGLDMLVALRQVAPRLPVLLFAEEALRPHAKRARGLGAGFVARPFGRAELAAALQAALVLPPATG